MYYGHKEFADSKPRTACKTVAQVGEGTRHGRTSDAPYERQKFDDTL